MRVLVTGSSGHLGEALVRTLRSVGRDVIGVDLRRSPFTSQTGSIADRHFVHAVMRDVDAVLHTATLHKPHVATHSRAAFVETNVLGTLNLLEEAAASRVGCFVYTSTTSTWGRALIPEAGQPAAWITEEVPPRPKNVYGATKLSAEHLCELVHRDHGLPCIILRTSRFFPEEDDRRATREGYLDANAKANEYLYRRVELRDVVDAHLAAIERAADIGFARYIISATTPFTMEDLADLRTHPARVIRRRFPRFEEIYAGLGWRMFPSIDRVYVNTRARGDLGWEPRIDFGEVLRRLAHQESLQSALADEVGMKGYHNRSFRDGPYPVRKQETE